MPRIQFSIDVSVWAMLILAGLVTVFGFVFVSVGHYLGYFENDSPQSVAVFAILGSLTVYVFTDFRPYRKTWRLFLGTTVCSRDRVSWSNGEGESTPQRVWLRENVPSWRYHIDSVDGYSVKFLYHRDAILYKLTWG